MAQTVCVILSSSDRQMLEAIVADRNRPRKHVGRVRQGDRNWVSIEVALDHAAAVEIWVGTYSMVGDARSDIGSVCM